MLESILKGEELIKLRCKYAEAEILLELDENKDPTRIIGCKHYEERSGKCKYLCDNCIYSHWKKLTQYKEE